MTVRSMRLVIIDLLRCVFLSLTMAWMLSIQVQAEVPELKPVPLDLPKDVHTALLKQAEELTAELGELARRNGELIKNCAAVDEGSVAAEKCRREQAALEDGRDHYVAATLRFNSIVDAEVSINELKTRIARDQEAIRRLGFSSRAEDFQEWEKLADEARGQFEEQALSSITDLLFAGAADANKAVIAGTGRLNTFSSQKLIGRLKEKGISDERVLNVIREIGAAKGKPARAKATKELIELVEKKGDLFNISQQINDNPGDIKTAAEAATTILSWGLQGPLAGVFASDVQFMYASLYNNLTRRMSMENIARLTTLTEQQLKNLSVLTGVLKKHASELQAARENLENLRRGWRL